MQKQTTPSSGGSGRATYERPEIIDQLQAKYPRGATLPPLAPFVNESPNRFEDISSEFWRVYDYGHGKYTVIELPQMLSVSKSGGHRVFDRFGISRYVIPGWINISWEASPNFVK